MKNRIQYLLAELEQINNISRQELYLYSKHEEERTFRIKEIIEEINKLKD